MNVYLKKINNRKSYMKYLLLADESEEIIHQYIDKGLMFEILYDHKTAGVCLFVFSNQENVEIKNIALDDSFRGRGIGKEVIRQGSEYFKARGFTSMTVGTANSSLDNIAFYQKSGFRFHEIRKGFFLDYPSPIFEYGIQAFDMIVFQKEL